MTLRQIEFLIQGYLMPNSIDEYRITEKLVLKHVMNRVYSDIDVITQNFHYSMAFVGVEPQDNGSHFTDSFMYIDTFCLLTSLLTNQPYTRFTGIGTHISTFSDLGKNRVSLPGFVSVDYIGKPVSRDSERMMKIKQAFQAIEPQYETFLKSNSGMALQFFQDAIQDNARRRLELVIVHLIMAAEALVITENTKITRNLCNRISMLIDETIDDKEKIKNDMKRFSRLRGDIVHGKKREVTIRDVNDLYRYIKNAIINSISLRNLSKKDLVEALDNISKDELDMLKKPIF